MKILVIGSGGREHALVWKLASEGHLVFCAPGNPGTESIATNIPLQPTDIEGLARFAKKNRIDFTVVGPEEPLYLGIVDYFEKLGLRIFGPTSAAAQIEKSKVFSRKVMSRSAIPQPKYAIFDNYEKALAYTNDGNTPCFVKASGPALGKGAIPCKTCEDAKIALHQLMIEKKFGSAGKLVVIEEWLTGEELSAHAVCDNNGGFILFPFSRDHKRVGNGDTGEMTGGMGTVFPCSSNIILYKRIKNLIVQPTLNELYRLGIPFKGLLFPGLMVKNGSTTPKVLEFNARFGDPETQVYMVQLKSSLAELLKASMDGTLNTELVTWRDGFSVCVVLASKGYPGPCSKGFLIEGVEYAGEVPGVVIFHAGTATRNYDGKLVTNGGRVLNVTCHAPTLEEALNGAHTAISRIYFEGMHFRSDIGESLLASN